MRAIGAAVLAATITTGCAHAPSISVLGAYFPDWLFCIVLGTVLTIITYVILNRAQRAHLLWPPALVYPSLLTLFSLSAWLVLFQH